MIMLSPTSVSSLTFTRGDFANAKWSNGRFSTLFCVIAAVWNSASLVLRWTTTAANLTCAAFLLTVLFSPYQWPVNAQNFNFSCGKSVPRGSAGRDR